MKALALICVLLSLSLNAMEKATEKAVEKSVEDLMQASMASKKIFGKLINKSAFMAFLVLKKGLAGLDSDCRLSITLRYLTHESYVDGKKRYDNRERLNVALEFLADQAYETWHPEILKAIENTESLYLLPTLSASGQRIEIKKEALVSFVTGHKYNVQLLAAIPTTLADKWKVMRELEDHVSSMQFEAFEKLMEDTKFDPHTQSQQNYITGQGRLIHENCRDLVEQVGYIADKYRRKNGGNGYTELTGQDFQNIEPTIEKLLRGWVEKFKINVNIKDLYHEDTPLSIIVRKEHAGKMTPVVKALLALGADPTIKNLSGKTPLDLCDHESVRKIMQDWVKQKEIADQGE